MVTSSIAGPGNLGLSSRRVNEYVDLEAFGVQAEPDGGVAFVADLLERRLD